MTIVKELYDLIKGLVLVTFSAGYSGKKIQRIQDVPTSGALSITPNADNYDGIDITAATGTITFNNPTGTPSNMQVLQVNIYAAGTQTITWSGNQYAPCGTALPTGTTTGKQMVMLLQWSSRASKWYLLSLAVEA